MKTFVIAQIFGALGMAMNAASYQAKRQKTVITVQLFGGLFFAVNMFMLGAVMGGLLNTLAVLRALVYSHKERFCNLRLWNGVFFALFFLSYVAVFALFGKPLTVPNLLIELLPLIGMVATTISFSRTEAASIRRLALISSPSWLVYNCINFSIGGILCEAFSLVSVVIAMFRLDFKRCGGNEN